MITIFTIPKPFRGHSGIIQENAIASLANLSIQPEILLFGNENGTAEIAQKYGAVHIPDIATNAKGIPLVSDAFQQAQARSSSDYLCYINADIILQEDFIQAIRIVATLQKPFLMTGQRYNTPITDLLDFSTQQNRDAIRKFALEHGVLAGIGGIDYFVFPRTFSLLMPPFVVGRPGWDNWMGYYFLSQKAMFIDSTQAVMAIHQNHDYSHHPQGKAGAYGEKVNIQLAGGEQYLFGLMDATHVLDTSGIRRAPLLRLKHLKYLRHRIRTVGMLTPQLRTVSNVVNKLYYSIRNAIT